MKEKLIKTDVAAITVKPATQLPTDVQTLSNAEQTHLKGGSEEEKRRPIIKKKK